MIVIKSYFNIPTNHSAVFDRTETPAEAYWVEVGGSREFHPYGMHRLVNLRGVEVVNSVTDDERHPRRWVLVRDGGHEVWVQRRHEDEYGYPLRPAERVSDRELEAITLKQRAISDGASVSFEEASRFVDSDDPAVLSHALIAGYYAAKADPDVADEDVDDLRETVREKTGHVDTDHVPTVLGILDDVLGDDGEEIDGSA